MYKYECHYTKTTSYKALDGLRSLMLSKSHCHLLTLPVELVSDIFIFAQNPALAITCTYFWQLSHSTLLRANYLLFRYGPSSVLGEAAMQRKIATTQVIHHLLTSGQADPKANGDDWLFIHACESNQTELGQWIIEATTQDTPTLTHFLNVAASRGSVAFVDLLIQQYHARFSNEEDTLLAMACRENHVNLVKHLVNHYGYSTHHHSELHLRNACAHGHHQLVEFILSTGHADVHAFGDAAIQSAAYKGFSQIVQMLIDAGAHVDTNQNVCFQFAVINNHVETLDCLVRNGVDPRMNFDWALRFACRKGLNQVAVYLLDCIGKEGPNLDEGMPLEAAVAHGHVSLVDTLLKRGADPNSRKAIRGLRYIMSPKSKTQHKDTMIRMLMEAGLDLTQPSCQQFIPLTQTNNRSNLFSALLSWM
ncbi:ankyrin repeat-containing domain protein [Blakeslea trispora]|nr:ankyrin repeat-containing domain protein [Blakeslea trispora]